MPITYRVDRERRIAFVEAQGLIGDADLLAFARQVAADPVFHSGVNELLDFRQADVGEVTSGAVQKVAEIFTKTSDPTSIWKAALVVPGDVGYGLSRMYTSFRGESAGEPRVFREMDEARAWLGLDPPEGD